MTTGGVGPQLGTQGVEGGGRPGHDEQTGRALVQTVHDAGSIGLPCPGRGQVGQLGVAGQEPVDQGATAVTGAVVDDQSRRLVHHDQIRVFVDHAELDPGVGPGAVGHRRGDVHPQRLARGQSPTADVDALTVHPHPALAHQTRHRAAG